MKSVLIALVSFCILQAQIGLPFPGPGSPHSSGGGSNTFTLVASGQGATIVSGTPVGHGPTNNGDLFIWMFSNDTASGGGISVSAVSGGGTFVIDSGCNGGAAGTIGYVACAYTLSSSSAANTTFTYTGSNITTYAWYEYSVSGTPARDNSNTCSISSGTTVNGCTPSLTGTNDVIVAAIISGNASNINSVTVYGNFLGANGAFSAWADLENSASTTPPAWTQASSSIAFGNYIAFK